MKRSIGVTAIAVLSFVGSAFMLLMGVVMLAVMIFSPAPSSPEFAASPAFFKLLMAGVALFYMFLAAWGIATGVGLLRLSPWARISTIVFAVLLVLTSAFSVLISLIIPTTSAGGPIDPSVTSAIRLSMGAFWGGLLAVGIWWLVFLNRASVKAQFNRSLSPVPPPSPELLIIGAQTSVVPAGVRKRPLSFTIIAWFLLIGCLFMPLNLVLHFPAILFNQFLTGWSATLLYMLLMAVSLYVGIGLLRYNRFAPVAGIAYFSFAFINSAIFYFAPGGRGRLRALLDAQQAIFPWVQPLQGKPQFQFDIVPLLFLGGGMGLVVLAVPLYFLVTRKRAFEEAAESL